jgi:hypothetical protein
MTGYRPQPSDETRGTVLRKTLLILRVFFRDIPEVADLFDSFHAGYIQICYLRVLALGVRQA